MKNIKKIICILLAYYICSAAIPIFAKEGQRLNFGDLIPSDKIEELENELNHTPSQTSGAGFLFKKCINFIKHRYTRTKICEDYICSKKHWKI